MQPIGFSFLASFCKLEEEPTRPPKREATSRRSCFSSVRLQQERQMRG